MESLALSAWVFTVLAPLPCNSPEHLLRSFQVVQEPHLLTPHSQKERGSFRRMWGRERIAPLPKPCCRWSQLQDGMCKLQISIKPAGVLVPGLQTTMVTLEAEG